MLTKCNILSVDSNSTEFNNKQKNPPPNFAGCYKITHWVYVINIEMYSFQIFPSKRIPHCPVDI